MPSTPRLSSSNQRPIKTAPKSHQRPIKTAPMPKSPQMPVKRYSGNFPIKKIRQGSPPTKKEIKTKHRIKLALRVRHFCAHLCSRRGPRTHQILPIFSPGFQFPKHTHCRTHRQASRNPTIFEWPLPPPTCIPCCPRGRRPRLCCRTGCQCFRITITSQQWQQRRVRTQRRTQIKSRELMYYQAVSENT